MRRGWPALAFLLLASCGGEDVELDKPFIPPQTCFAPAELGGSPTTIDAFVDHLNALPRPLTVPCLLQSLDRPLLFEATWNTLSLQPGYGPNNPRIILYRDGFRISVVPKGEGRPLVEVSEERSPTRSIKGELLFPIEDVVTPAAPYERILHEQGGTKCAFCHLAESIVPDITVAEAYQSDVVEIIPGKRVRLDYLLTIHEICDREQEPDRCAMLDSVLAYGEVIERLPE